MILSMLVLHSDETEKTAMFSDYYQKFNLKYNEMTQMSKVSIFICCWITQLFFGIIKWKFFQSIPFRPNNLLLFPSLFSTSTASDSTDRTLCKQDLSSNSPDSSKRREISSDNISDALLSTTQDQQTADLIKINNQNHCSSTLDDKTTQLTPSNETVMKKEVYHSLFGDFILDAKK